MVELLTAYGINHDDAHTYADNMAAHNIDERDLGYRGRVSVAFAQTQLQKAGVSTGDQAKITTCISGGLHGKQM